MKKYDEILSYYLNLKNVEVSSDYGLLYCVIKKLNLHNTVSIKISVKKEKLKILYKDKEVKSLKTSFKNKLAESLAKVIEYVNKED